MAKKSEIIGEFIVTIHDNGSVEVSRIYKVTKDALKEIWTSNRKEMPEKDWTTQEWGRQVLKEFCGGAKEGVIGEYSVQREDNNRINVIRTYKNTKDGLREVAKELNFLPDPKQQGWNTQRYGAVLVKFAQTGEMPKLKEENKTNKKMKEIKIYLYGEGCRLDVYDDADEFSECYNAMRDSEYFEIKVKDGDKETEYEYSDFGSQISSSEWPEEVYDYEEGFYDPKYAKFDGKEPSDVFEFGGCDLYEAEAEGLGRIEMIQTKIPASVTIELHDDEEFDPKKLHFMYSEFVVPDAELEINPGVVYDGKQYEIELDVESEREISTETIWESMEVGME
ncbi:MAG: hypothetical protein K2M69_00710 [Muribaculaceae bacterium]|nr:hypothetical protein [Muribaculaceae bacterium]